LTLFVKNCCIVYNLSDAPRSLLMMMHNDMRQWTGVTSPNLYLGAYTSVHSSNLIQLGCRFHSSNRSNETTKQTHSHHVQVTFGQPNTPEFMAWACMKPARAGTPSRLIDEGATNHPHRLLHCQGLPVCLVACTRQRQARLA
jgi:hypothetical protein